MKKVNPRKCTRSGLKATFESYMFSQYQIWPDSDFFVHLNVLVEAKIIFLIPASMKVDRGYNMVTPHCLSLCVLVWVVAGVGGSPSSLRRGKSV